MKDVIKLVVNGLELQTFESYELKNSMTSVTTDFSFSFLPQYNIINGKINWLNIVKTEEPVLIYINDILYLTGNVARAKPSASPNGKMYTIQGCDAVSFRLLRHYPKPKNYKIKDFTELARTVIADNGFANEVKVQNLTLKPLPIDTQEEIQIEDGETLFNFLDRYAKKAQVLLNTTGTGELVIYREGDLGTLLGKFPNKAKAGVALIHDVANKQKTNILSMDAEHSVWERYQVIEIFSQSGNKNHSVKGANPTATATDSQIKIQNRLRLGNASPTSSTTLQDMANWHLNIRRSQGQSYNCKVQGFRFSPTNRDFWKINTYVEIFDDFADVNGEFLIESVTFKQDTNGTTTDLTIVNKGSFILDPKQAVIKARVNNFGNRFQS